MERALFSHEGRRGKSESMIQYVARKRTLLQELSRVGCQLPSQAAGYIMMRDAGLSDRAWDTVETWTRGSYEVTEIATNLRKLERPMPGRPGGQMGMTGFEQGSPAQSWDEPPPPSPETAGPRISKSLFIELDQFDDDTLLEAVQVADDPQIYYVSGDFPDDHVFDEEEATAIMANYNQVRKYLHTKKLGRGFFKGQGKGKGGKQSSPGSAPKRWSRQSLVARTKCARCGKIGHLGARMHQ